MATLITARPEGMLQFLNPLALVRNLWQHRDLIRQFTVREVVGRYKGSVLGLFWSFLNPLVLLLAYTFVFGLVFQARWPNARTQSLGEFALVIFCGMIAYNIFSDIVSRAPSLIIGVPNYVKRVVFPLEVLLVSTLGAALFHSLVSLSILIVGNFLATGQVAWTLLLLPLVALPLVFLSLGLSWFLASLGVFVRDIGHSVGLLLQVLFFTTPIFFSFDSIPEPFRTIVRFNPLSSIVENFRRVVLWGTLPSWPGLLLWLLVTSMIMLFGYAWFMKTKKAFADVI